MDKVEKMDYGANGEVIFGATNPLPSQSPKISDQGSQRKRLTGGRNWVHYLIIEAKNGKLS
jgi:hypothetical protein